MDKKDIKITDKEALLLISEQIDNIAIYTDVSIAMNAVIAAKVLTEKEINEIFEAVTKKLKKHKLPEDKVEEIVEKIKKPILNIKGNVFKNKTM